jgi:hypothetical protein
MLSRQFPAGMKTKIKFPPFFIAKKENKSSSVINIEVRKKGTLTKCGSFCGLSKSLA